MGLSILTVCIGILISGAISRPLMRLQRAAMEISKGNLDASIQAESNDEIGDLASAFKTMVKNLKYSQNKMKEEAESHKATAEKLRKLSCAVEQSLNH